MKRYIGAKSVDWWLSHFRKIAESPKIIHNGYRRIYIMHIFHNDVPMQNVQEGFLKMISELIPGPFNDGRSIKSMGRLHNEDEYNQLSPGEFFLEVDDTVNLATEIPILPRTIEYLGNTYVVHFEYYPSDILNQ